MRHEWNEALAAYDREQHVLRLVAEEYETFLQELFEAVRDRANAALLAPVGEPSLGDEEPHDWGLDWADPLVPACAGVDVALYNAGPVGLGVAAMCLDMRLGLDPADGWPAPDERRRRLVPPGEDPERDGPRLVLQRNLLPFAEGAPGLARALVEAIRQAEALNARLEEGTPASAVRWGDGVLKANGKRVFDGADAFEDGPWHGAYSIQGTAREVKAWFALFPDGRVTIHWGTKRGVDEAEQRRVLGMLGLDSPDTTRSYAGGVVVTPEQLGEFARVGDPEPVVGSLREVWRRFLTAHGA